MSVPLRPTTLPRRPIHHLRGEDSLGWGIIGASQVAGRHVIPAIRNQPPIPVKGARYAMTNAWIAGLYSHNERRAQAFAETHQIAQSYTNLADLLRRTDIQCVYISSHPRHHATFALAALHAGKHVLCEPPLALTLDDAQAVVQAAAQRDLVVAVNFPHRGNAAIAVIHNLLLDGEIGEVCGGRICNTLLLRPAQQTWRLARPGGGVLFDRTAHTIDTLRFLFHDEVAAIDCVEHQKLLGSQVEEDVLSRISLQRSGLTFQCHDSFGIPHHPTSIKIFGATGMLAARGCLDHAYTGELILRRNDQETRLRLPTANPFATAVARFHSAVRARVAPQADGGDGLAVLRAVLAGHESLRRGYRVTLDPRPPLVTVPSHI